MVFKRLINELPENIRPNDPTIRYVIAERGRRFNRGVWWQLMMCVITLAVVIGAYTALGLFVNLPLSNHAMNVLYLPTFGAQIVMSVVGLVLTMGAIVTEKRHQNWDSLRATPDGVSIVLRAHWAVAVFYRMRGLLIFVLLTRAVLLALVAYDLTAYNGDYLNLITGNIVPEVSPLIGGLFLAITLTAIFLLPVTSIGFDAAVGLVIGTFIKQRVFVSLIQLMMVAVRVALVAVVFLLSSAASIGDAPDPLLRWIGVFLLNGFGDSGLLLLNVPSLAEVWQEVPYALFLGVALIGAALVQAALTEVMLRYAMRRAQKIE